VLDFPIRGGVLKQTQRNALVRSAIAGVVAKAPVKKASGRNTKSILKGK
jgi:hypothetical protein